MTLATRPPSRIGLKRLHTGMDDIEREQFAAKHPLILEWVEKCLGWLGEQKVLFEALLIALSLHVVMFPVLWFIGWALPWPKSPVITTVIEYDLQEWLKTGKPKKVTDFRDPELNK